MNKRRSSQQIVGLLQQADVDLGKGMTVPDVCRRLGMSQQTYYRWRTKFGGMDPKMAKQLQELQKENSRLKKLVADQALDMLILNSQTDVPEPSTWFMGMAGLACAAWKARGCLRAR